MEHGVVYNAPQYFREKQSLFLYFGLYHPGSCCQYRAHNARAHGPTVLVELHGLVVVYLLFYSIYFRIRRYVGAER
jgi:hypothetical protein